MPAFEAGEAGEADAAEAAEGLDGLAADKAGSATSAAASAAVAAASFARIGEAQADKVDTDRTSAGKAVKDFRMLDRGIPPLFKQYRTRGPAGVTIFIGDFL